MVAAQDYGTHVSKLLRIVLSRKRQCLNGLENLFLSLFYAALILYQYSLAVYQDVLILHYDFLNIVH